MTKEQLADLVADMRAKQNFFKAFGEKYKAACVMAERQVDEAVRNILLGKW